MLGDALQGPEPDRYDWTRFRLIEEENARLRAALKPFRDLIEVIECTAGHPYADDAEWDLNAGDHSVVTLGDLRRAREAYGK